MNRRLWSGLLAALILFAFAGYAAAAPGDITTFAGDGTPGFSGDSGQAASANLDYPTGVAVDSIGNIYIADCGNNRIRKVATDGIITTFAGDGTAGFSGDSGQAATANLYSPYGVAIDSIGNIYIADYGNNRIRKVATDGVITTVAGDGTAGYSGDSGPAASASLNHPTGVAIDSIGNVYIADYMNNRIRKVATDGIITTVAGNGVRAYAGDGRDAISASLYNPTGVAVDSIGNIYIADFGGSHIRKVGTDGIINNFAGNGTGVFSGDNGPATAAGLYRPFGVAIDSTGNIYIADQSQRIRKVGTDGIINTVAGNGTLGFSGDYGPATSANLNYPAGMAVDSNGNIYIADTDNNRIRKVEGNAVPTLTYSADVGYADGLAPDTGTASTWFTYKAVYTSASNIAPTSVRVCIDAVCDAMSVDSGATAILHDGNYANGEQYVDPIGFGFAAGSHNYYFDASDGVNTVLLPSSGTLSGPTVSDLVISTATIPDGSTGVAYSTTLSATGGTAPYTWSMTGWALPAGLTYNSSTGEIYGTPAQTAMTMFTANVTDSVGYVYSTYLWITITQGPDVTPPVVTPSASGGTYLTAQSVTLSANEAATIYYTTDGSTPTTASAVYSAPIAISATTTLKYFGRDTAGNSGAVQTQVYTINIDTTPPTGSITINRGAASTTSTSVTLTLTCVDAVGCSQMRFSNDNSTWSAWQAYGASKAWTLTAGSGTKRVYVQFKDGAGNASTSYSDTIIFGIIDLSVSALTAPASITTGTAFTVSSTVLNGGTGPSTSSTTKLYLSADAVITASDTFLGSRSITALAAGASSVGATSVTIPVSTAPGVYYIGAIADANGTNAESNETNNTRSQAVTVASGVDLRVSVLSAPASITTGAAFTVSSTVLNGGTAPSVSSTMKLYLSTDAVITTADTYLGSRSIAVLAGGASSAGATSVTISVSTAPGVYYIGAIADATGTNAESNETDNTASQAVTVASGVDLSVSALSAPATITTGAAAMVSTTVANTGTSPSASSAMKLYLSTDAVITTADTYLGSRSIAALAAGMTSAGATSVLIPVSTAPGYYYIGAIADANSTNAESNEANNTASQAVRIASGVDLRVAALSAPATITTGAAASVSTTITNSGTSPSASSTMKLYLSTDSVITAADTFIGSRSITALAAGASSAGATSVTISVSTAPGNYYIGAIADATGTNAESNEANNTASFGVTIVSGVDLRVPALSAPAAITTGAAATVSTTVFNSGTSTSASSTMKLYLSTDSVITTADTYLGSRSIAALAGGASNAGTTSVTIPVSTAPGAYYIGAIADATGTNAESNEANNTRYQAVTVVSGVNLSVSVLSAPTPITRGTAASVSTTILNSGTSPSATSTMKLYLSTDAVITAADTYLGSRSIATLAALASSAGTTSVLIPVTTVAGVYYIGAIADANSTNAESNETNNAASQAVTIAP